MCTTILATKVSRGTTLHCRGTHYPLWRRRSLSEKLTRREEMEIEQQADSTNRDDDFGVNIIWKTLL